MFFRERRGSGGIFKKLFHAEQGDVGMEEQDLTGGRHTGEWSTIPPENVPEEGGVILPPEEKTVNLNVDQKEEEGIEQMAAK